MKEIQGVVDLRTMETVVDRVLHLYMWCTIVKYRMFIGVYILNICYFLYCFSYFFFFFFALQKKKKELKFPTGLVWYEMTQEFILLITFLLVSHMLCILLSPEL